jgi:hypothetical protein
VGVTAHLRGIVIAGGLAALALALGFVTLLMNQTASQAAPHTVLPLKARHHTTTTQNGASVKVVKRVDPNLVAALDGGLPRSVAKGLAAKPVVVVELTSPQDSVAKLALGEAKAGAADGGASFVSVDVDVDGGDVQVLTRLLGELPVAPAALVYTRPATLYVTLPGFNDRVTIQQAVQNAAPVTTVSALAVTSDWATRAVVICRETYAQLGTIGPVNDPVKLAAQKTQFKAIGTRFLTQMKALKPAAGKAAQVKQLNVLLAKSFATENAIIAAGAAHNLSALVAAKGRATGYQLQINKLERKLGASGCVEAAA